MAKLQYASGIQYFADSLTVPGAAAQGSWRDSSDNPMSSSFIPLEVRPAQDKARWWANHYKRQHQVCVTGEFG